MCWVNRFILVWFHLAQSLCRTLWQWAGSHKK